MVCARTFQKLNSTLSLQIKRKAARPKFPLNRYAWFTLFASTCVDKVQNHVNNTLVFSFQGTFYESFYISGNKFGADVTLIIT